MSYLSDIYHKTSPVISMEFFPPRDPTGIEGMKSLITRLVSELAPDFLTVTYGAGGGTRELTRVLTKFIATELNITAVAHLTCVGHSQEEIGSLLKDYNSDGISNILALRGDRKPDMLEDPDEYKYAYQLVKDICSQNLFCVAVAGYPEKHPESKSVEQGIQHLKEKVDAGAQVVFTQLFFDNELYFKFVEKVRALGITVPLVPGIMPIANFKQVKRFTSLCGASIPNAILNRLSELEGDELGIQSFGTEWATRQCEELIRNGAPGIHFYTLNRSAQVENVVNNLGCGKINSTKRSV